MAPTTCVEQVALLSALFEPTRLSTVLQKHVQQEFFLLAFQQARAKLAEHRKIDMVIVVIAHQWTSFI
jgi:hypothetical protein